MIDKLIVKQTLDGTTTLYDKELDEHYHSTHGSLQEAIHVFIKNGLEKVLQQRADELEHINILEVGFGTGLNCLLSLSYDEGVNFFINYTGIEPHPVPIELINKMNYNFDELQKKLFSKIHQSKWNLTNSITTKFSLNKQQVNFQDFKNKNKYDLIFFDAFGPRVEKFLWNKDVFKKAYEILNNNGLLVTYCAKGQVRRDLEEVGFFVERLNGPVGKREMLRANKIVK